MSTLTPLRLGIVLLTLIAVSCDSGDIEETAATIKSSGKTVKLTASFTGLDTWKAYNYNVVLAGFSTESDYAVAQTIISGSIMGTTEGAVAKTVVFSGISSNVDNMELAITNSMRTRVITIASIDMADYESNSPSDTIYMDLGDVDVTLFGVIQSGIFDKACIACHGAGASSAGNTNLTEGKALANLVDVASTQRDGYTRVVSGDPESSLLWIILNEGGEDALHYNHTEVLSSQFKNNLSYVKQLLSDWITSLN